jgi:hypothetical protein
MAKSKTTKKTTKKNDTKSEESKAKKTNLTAPGDCLSFSRAGMIVQKCAGGPHDIDKTLEEIGIFTEGELDVFRECVFEGVLDNGCQISREDIPNASDNTLREVRDTIADTAE